MIFIIIFLIAVLHLLILSQLNFTAWPEMLTYPYLFSNSFILYKDFIVPYPPGLILILSIIFNIFDFSPDVLKVFTWILILLTDLILYFILKRIFKNNFVTFIFLIFYIFLQSFLDGNMLWFDYAAVLPLLLGFYCCFRWINKKNNKLLLIFIGLFLSIAVIIKQVNLLYFLVFGIIYIYIRKKIILKEILYFLSGCLIILMPILFYIFQIQAILEFWNWVFLYPITEWSKFPGYVNFNISKRQLIIIFFMFIPIIFTFFSWKKLFTDKTFLLMFLFLLVSVITIYPRFSFFHMQPAIAFLIIILTKVFCEVPQKLKILYLITILITVIFIVVLNYNSVIGNKIRFYDNQDLQLSKQITKKINNNEKIYLLGINSSEYVFTKTIPPKHWSDNFGWYLEITGIQKWVIDGIKNADTKIIIWKVPSSGQWYELGVYQPQEIINYIRLNYHKTDNIEPNIEIWEIN